MKKTLLLALGSFIATAIMAQLKTTAVCPPMYVDVLGGKVNSLAPNSTAGQVKIVFPCFTTETDPSSACGASVSYKDKDIYFFSGRNYIEIGAAFKGRLSIPLLGANRNSLFKWLGLPKIKDIKWDAFQTQYGTIVLYYSAANRVNKIQFSTLSTEQIKLCE